MSYRSSSSKTALAGCLMILFVVLANALFWGGIIWAVAAFVLPHLSFWH